MSTYRPVEYTPTGNLNVPYKIVPAFSKQELSGGSGFLQVYKEWFPRIFWCLFIGSLVLKFIRDPFVGIFTALLAIPFYYGLKWIASGKIVGFVFGGLISLIFFWMCGVWQINLILIVLTYVFGVCQRKGYVSSVANTLAQVHGVAGGHIGSNTDFGVTAQVGAYGERVTGQDLEFLTRKYPFVRVFHGLCFTPGKPGADIDHIVLIGDKVFLVDSKNWDSKQGVYAWSQFGGVTRGGNFFNGGDVHMEAALDKWKQYLSGLTRNIQVRITLTQKPSSNYGINNFGAPRNVLLTTNDELIHELDMVAANTRPVVNRFLVYKICKQLQLPNKPIGMYQY